MVAFHLAYGVSTCRAGILVFLYCLLCLALLPTTRSAFYAGLLVGLGIYAPQLGFFWTLFGFSAVALWMILAFWVGLFVALSHLCRHHFGVVRAAILIPFLWTGVEYFRSELYCLRFSWLNVGFALSDVPSLAAIGFLGVYGIGFVLAALAACLSLVPGRIRLIACAAVLTGLTALFSQRAVQSTAPAKIDRRMQVVGIQVEFPVPLEVPGILDRALRQCPTADLFLLSEYAFDGPVPERVKQWCKRNQRYLVVGGTDPVSSTEYYNTAFVIGPSGQIVFKQAKSVPIQFFKDGRPAKEQKLWHSPWGAMGICICYDLSYSQVTDELVRQGAQALLVPTMDVMDWGQHEHTLHARIAPMKAAEYALPIVRLASSGVSQAVDQHGTVLASVPFPGQGELLIAEIRLAGPGRLPIDRYLAPLATGVTAFLACWFVAASIRRKHFSRASVLAPAEPHGAGAIL